MTFPNVRFTSFFSCLFLLFLNLSFSECALFSEPVSKVTVQSFPSPFRVPHIISAQFNDFQNYNGVGYVHGGTDLGVPAGTEVYSPVDGRVSISRYIIRSKPSPPEFAYERTFLRGDSHSEKNNAHLYIEVAITDSEDRIWYFRHIDGNSIPSVFLQSATTTMRIRTGDYIGKVVPWIASVTPEQRLYDHVHLEVVDAKGYFLNPNRLLLGPEDTVPPTISRVWFLPNQSEQAFTASEGVPVIEGAVDIVAETFDCQDGFAYRHVPYEIGWGIFSGPETASESVIPFHVVHRFDRIPQCDDRTRYSDLFFQAKLRELNSEITSEGNNVTRRFLIHLANGDIFTSFSPELAFDTRLMNNGRFELVVFAKDLHGNLATLRQSFQVKNRSKGSEKEGN